jgi:hypothetical protein
MHHCDWLIEIDDETHLTFSEFLGVTKSGPRSSSTNQRKSSDTQNAAANRPVALFGEPDVIEPSSTPIVAPSPNQQHSGTSGVIPAKVSLVVPPISVATKSSTTPTAVTATEVGINQLSIIIINECTNVGLTCWVNQ